MRIAHTEAASMAVDYQGWLVVLFCALATLRNVNTGIPNAVVDCAMVVVLLLMLQRALGTWR